MMEQSALQTWVWCSCDFDPPYTEGTLTCHNYLKRYAWYHRNIPIPKRCSEFSISFTMPYHRWQSNSSTAWLIDNCMTSKITSSTAQRCPWPWQFGLCRSGVGLQKCPWALKIKKLSHFQQCTRILNSILQCMGEAAFTLTWHPMAQVKWLTGKLLNCCIRFCGKLPTAPRLPIMSFSKPQQILHRRKCVSLFPLMPFCCTGMRHRTMPDLIEREHALSVQFQTLPVPYGQKWMLENLNWSGPASNH